MKRIARNVLALSLLISAVGCGKKVESDAPSGNANQEAKPVTEMKLGEKTEALEDVVSIPNLPKPYLYGVQKKFSLTLNETTKIRIETESSAFGCDKDAKTKGPFVTLTAPDGKIVTNNEVLYADKIAAGLSAEVVKGVQKIQVDFYSDKECMAFGYTFKITKDSTSLTPTVSIPPAPPVNTPPVLNPVPVPPVLTSEVFDTNLLGVWNNNNITFKFDANRQSTMEVYYAGQVMFKMIQDVSTNTDVSPKQMDLTVKEIPIQKGRSNFKIGEKISCIYEYAAWSLKVNCNKNAESPRPTTFSGDTMVLKRKN